MTHRSCSLAAPLGLFLAAIAAAGCAVGPSASGSFDRTLSVIVPIRLELANASGDVSITGSIDGKVHVHGEVRSSGIGFASPQKRLDEIVSNPPIEQKGDTVRIGKDLSRIRNLSISYVIEVPRDTEVDTTVASGSQTIRGVRGPVKVQSASGSIRVDNIDRKTQLSTLSGSIDAQDIGDELRASSASGSVTVSGVKGDVRISALSGATQIIKPGGRVDADTASGSVEVQGATTDVKAHAASGKIDVSGNPGSNSYWDLKTVSGAVELGVPSNANFHLSADAVSGQIKTDVPIVIEEQGKHSLRARVGTGGGRVEVHTISGEIRVRAS
jgi:Putative adhesin